MNAGRDWIEGKGGLIFVCKRESGYWGDFMGDRE